MITSPTIPPSDVYATDDKSIDEAIEQATTCARYSCLGESSSTDAFIDSFTAVAEESDGYPYDDDVPSDVGSDLIEDESTADVCDDFRPRIHCFRK